MTLFVDKLFGENIGGVTNDLRKIEYALAIHKMSINQIKSRKTLDFYGTMFHTGKWIVALSFDYNLDNITMGIISYQIDLDKHFDAFADCLSPKAVQGFHTLKQEVRKKSIEEIESFSISDVSEFFEIAYLNYKEHRNHQ